MQASGGTGIPERKRWDKVEELCDRYLGGHPSEAALEVLRNAEQQRPEVRDFVERAFRLMAISKFHPRDFSPFVARFFTVIAPGILPGAWGGIVPPFTLPGRHKKIDAYLRSNKWASFKPGTVLLDVGCGFPPQTAIDAAEAFPEWRVVGLDPTFEQYLLYDERENYACLDGTGKVRYFQAGRPDEFLRLYSDRNATIQHFSEAFAQLLPRLPSDDRTPSTVEDGGRRLVRNPLSAYERCNLKFVQGGFGSTGLPEAGVVRCFNVLIYYDADFRRQAEEWVARVLRPGGLFVCGRDDSGSLNAHYSVYCSEGGRLVEKEFAFGVETVRHSVWFALHDGERETWRLAELLGTLRSDREFLNDYDVRLDALLAENRMAIRDENGFLIEPPSAIEPARALSVYQEVVRKIEAEFTDRAVSVLQRAGLHAWRNSVGHIAVGEGSMRQVSSGEP
jgi:SAM-dependent methyltransferase